MMTTISTVSALLAAAALTGGVMGKDSTSITIYSSAQPGAIPAEMYRPVAGGTQYGGNFYRQIPGYAMVRQNLSLEIAKGVGELRLTEVAALIEPTTVQFVSLSDPGTKVLEQDFKFDLVSNEKLIQRFLGQEVSATVSRGEKAEVVRGTLLSGAFGSIVLQRQDGGVEVLNGVQAISFPTLPGGLMTKPTLAWKVSSEKGGKQDVRVSYQTEGITWWADYNLVLEEGKTANEGKVDVSAWVSILNQSGGTYNDATLKLIAGEVHRAPPQYFERARGYPQPPMSMVKEESAGFQEKSFFEYHLYTLGRPATIPDNSTKQLELFPTARGIACEKVLVYNGLSELGVWYGGEPMGDQNYGVQSKKDVDIYLRFENSEKKGMGMPLPAGRIRVSKLDPADGSLEFIGEDTIKHTPREEEVLVRLGKAFDVVGERKQVDFSIDMNRKTMSETIEVKVRNRKQEAVEVVVQERLYRWTNWEITKPTTEFRKLDASTIQFPVKIEKDGEAVVRYTVRYTW
jgi:hypothetical protein